MPWPQAGSTHYHVCTVRTGFKGLLSATVCCSLDKFDDLWDGSMDQLKVRGVFPCCGQDGYQAQVLQHPIDTCRQNEKVVLNALLLYFC